MLPHCCISVGYHVCSDDTEGKLISRTVDNEPIVQTVNGMLAPLQA